MKDVIFVIAGTEITKDIIDTDVLILMQISKAEVRQCDHKRIDDALALLCEAKEYGRLALAFDYDDDPRELFEIPEVCLYICEIILEHIDLFAYIAPSFETFHPLVLPYVGAQIIGKFNGKAQVGISDIDGARKKIQKLLNDASTTILAGKQDFRAVHDLDKAMHSIGILL